MKIQIDCPKELSAQEILKSLSLFIENPYQINDILYGKRRKKNLIKKSIIISSEIYSQLKSLCPHNKIELIIESIISQINDELYYGSILFKDKNLWEREKIIRHVGRIDGLNIKEKLIVELKFVRGWKSALGQILAYGHFYPTFQKEIWLLGNKKICAKEKNYIREICENLSVITKFINLD